MSQLLKRFKRDITGLFWFSTGVFIGLALFSFSPTDPSFNSLGRALKAQNQCGYVGSFLADLIYQTFGLAGWLFVFGSLKLAWSHFRGPPRKPSISGPALALLMTVVFSSLLALYFPTHKLWGQIHAGGIVGHIVTSSLVRALNSIGVTVVLWTMAATLIIFYTEKTVEELFQTPMEWVREIWSRFKSFEVPQIFSRWFDTVELQAVAMNAAPSPKTTLPPRFFPLTPSSKREDEAGPAEPAQGVFPGFTFSPQKEVERVVRLPAKAKASRRIENWELPKLSLLQDPPLTRYKIDEREIKEKAKLLTEKLAQFSVRGNVVGVKPGPAVTLFEFKPAPDVKISKITELADDLSLALSSESVRIIAPIPGRDVVGIETSNAQREGVFLKDILARDDFWDDEVKLPLALGRKADGEPRVVDLRKMPHLLVAGSTGSGKSVFVVSMLVSLLFRHSPKTLRLILVDPKQVDLAAFGKIPHLIMPPIREPRKAVGALRWAIREMEKRYRSMSHFGARGLESYNEIVQQLSKNEIGEHDKNNEAYESKGLFTESYYYHELPYLVIVVEEFGDLMAVDKQNVEQAVVRLAQMARACGIHLVLAMQSPRKDVVTGLIKTNIPGRVSFKVASKMDSRIILDEGGAERLLARGDMLFLAPGVSKPERHHGPYLSEDEINEVVGFWEAQGEPEFDSLALKAIENSGGGYELRGSDDAGDDAFDENDDVLKDDRYDEILAYVASQKEVSASLLQRRFRLGYPRAARMIEVFEAEGVIGPANGSKPRQVLVSELK